MGQKLKFTATNTKAIIDWLNQFVAIDSSLVIEMDIFNKLFVAKSSTTDRSFACYSTLPFEDATIEFDMSSDFDFLNSDNKRLKLGILLSLDKFINILGPFSKSNVQLTVDVVPKQIKEPADNDMTYYSVGRLTLKNDELQMVYNFAEDQHFIFITDKFFFNSMYKLADPIQVEIPNSSIKESLSINDIYNNNAKKDRVEFSFESDEDDSKYISRITTSDAEGNYKMDLITLEDTERIPLHESSSSPDYPTVFKLLKKYLTIFLKSVNTADTSVWQFPYDSQKSMQNRVLIKSGNSYFCIGGVNIEDFETI